MTSNPMQDEMTQAALIVTDADREAYLSLNTLPAKYRDAVMAGEWDKTTGVQAFARHRHQAEQRGGEAGAMREALEALVKEFRSKCRSFDSKALADAERLLTALGETA